MKTHELIKAYLHNIAHVLSRMEKRAQDYWFKIDEHFKEQEKDLERLYEAYDNLKEVTSKEVGE